MLLPIAELLTQDQVRHARQILDAADWVDGRVTAGHQSARAKDNVQLPESSPAARDLRDLVLNALGQNPLFISAALPLQVFPPLFNRYSGGQSFGTHVDNAIRQVTGTGQRIVLHAIDGVGLVHALLLRIQALLLPIKTLVLSGH